MNLQDLERITTPEAFKEAASRPLTAREWRVLRWALSESMEADRGEIFEPRPTTEELKRLEAWAEVMLVGAVITGSMT